MSNPYTLHSVTDRVRGFPRTLFHLITLVVDDYLQHEGPRISREDINRGFSMVILLYILEVNVPFSSGNLTNCQLSTYFCTYILIIFSFQIVKMLNLNLKKISAKVVVK